MKRMNHCMRTCVRMTRAQFLKLKKESLETGKSITHILKEHYFPGGIPQPRLGSNEAKYVLETIRRIGQDLNTTVQRMHLGHLDEVGPGVDETLRQIRGLKTWIKLNGNGPTERNEK